MITSLAENRKVLYLAWLKLLVTFILSFSVSLLVGIILIKICNIDPESIYSISTKRLSYASSVLEKGGSLGIDSGIILFFWNLLGALATVSFLYTATLFNPGEKSQFPQGLRNVFCGRKKMKALCYLPGCFRIHDECLRRLYVWLMVPLLGIILLGMECGFAASTSTYIFGSYFLGVVYLLPHGLIEIPAICLAGAVTYSAHLLISKNVHHDTARNVFKTIGAHRNAIPLKKITLIVTFCLLLAGTIEAHFTTRIIESLFVNA
ncbi:MAG: stage II sporulation protein M [Desulfobulbaceae bacterium]|nr:stage II sporulation protein M [Desulfobulbaceae bacterium]